MLPSVYFDYRFIRIYLSGAVATDNCYYEFDYKNNLPTNTIYKVSFNIQTDKIEDIQVKRHWTGVQANHFEKQ